MEQADLLIQNARQLIHFIPAKSDKKHKDPVLSIQEGACLAVLGNSIAAFGSKSEVLSKVSIGPKTKIIDADDKIVTPGLIDPHTHPVFFHTRVGEFEMRIRGESYEKIAAAGGGIRNSVKAVRKAGKEELKEKIRPRLKRFLEYGTTTIEAKSGYGLSFDAEIKSLEVIAELNEEGPLEMIPTFLGAHEMPDEYRQNRKEYIKLLLEKMIPYVARKRLAKFCDVFCEKGVYSIDESRKILQGAKKSGLKVKIHADQLHLTGATKLAVELGAISADHLEQIDEAGVKTLKDSETFAGLLPGSVFFLGSYRYPPARQLIDAGARVFLATDFNPGSSMTQSMPLMMTLACVFMKMTPAEVLTASTIMAAAAIGCEHFIGNIKPGYQADIVVWDTNDYRKIPYYYGINLVQSVIKKGKVVFEKT